MSRFEVKNIECSRQDNLLFQDISFQLLDGELIQVNGVNGSGKSSLMQICAGLIEAKAGQVLWNDTPIHQCRYVFQADLSYIGHMNGVKDALTAEENMKVMHALSGLSKTVDYSAILEQVGLSDMEDILLARMSAGQKRRLGLTRIFMSTAKLWLLDEPFNALDKNGKKIIEDRCLPGKTYPSG